MINVSAQIYYAITAGHCTWDTVARKVREYWYTNPNYTVYLGNEASTHLGNGEDFGLIRYANNSLSRPGTVHSYKSNKDYDITGSGWATSPDYVCKSGRTTGTTCGHVIYSCVDVDYLDKGVVRRLECSYETDLCTAGGDSGGPIWKGTEAIAIHIAGGGSAWNGSWSDDTACGATHREWGYKVPFIEAAYGYIVY